MDLGSLLMLIGAVGLGLCLIRAVGDIERLERRVRKLETRDFRDDGGVVRPGLNPVQNTARRPETVLADPDGSPSASFLPDGTVRRQK